MTEELIFHELSFIFTLQEVQVSVLCVYCIENLKLVITVPVDSLTGLDIKACLHVDHVPGHINFCGYMPDWESDFTVWACTYFTAVYINFAGLVQILVGHVKMFAGHVNFHNHMPIGHVYASSCKLF